MKDETNQYVSRLRSDVNITFVYNRNQKCVISSEFCLSLDYSVRDCVCVRYCESKYMCISLSECVSVFYSIGACVY